ncbi:MAG: TetR/AcrR family transcriptional regulator [Bdellovibrionaceae bacterium]|nr:TetR/AcrR family transcriptional regulator [Pseudobdellovibrionaceae bacterium]
MSKPLGLRERNKADKLFRIKSAAKQLFEKQGYDETTTKQIADLAGVAAGTVFLYAKTKDEILYLIYEDEMTRVRDAAFDSIRPDAKLVDAVFTMFGAFFRYYGESPALARAFIHRFIFIDPMMSERYMTFQHDTFEKLALLVVRSQDRGETRADLDPLLVISSFWAVYGSCLVFFLQTNSRDVEAGLRHLRSNLELIVSGLEPRPVTGLARDERA